MNKVDGMQYRKGCGEDKLSVLGYGCMRFTGKGFEVFKERAVRMPVQSVCRNIGMLIGVAVGKVVDYEAVVERVQQAIAFG